MKIQNPIRPIRGCLLAMKAILLYTSIASLLTAVVQAQNENIIWKPPVTISGTSDVSTE